MQSLSLTSFFGLYLSITSMHLLGKENLPEHQEKLLSLITREHELDKSKVKKLRSIFATSKYIGQGSPASNHPVSRRSCLQRWKKENLFNKFSKKSKQCGQHPWMSPISPKSDICIDRFEFPNIPCAYPVVWVRAREAALICEAIGKRLCDADEWEGACANRYIPDQFRESIESSRNSPASEIKKRRLQHNKKRDVLWAYGDKKNHSLCATQSSKSPGCDRAQSQKRIPYDECGSNTYPSGYFSSCASESGVFDLHGNAAEHMNLPLTPSQRSRAEQALGYTEMKGSWYIFSSYEAHRDDCYWRAPFWHGSKVKDKHTHRNYHLSFRCCL